MRMRRLGAVIAKSVFFLGIGMLAGYFVGAGTIDNSCAHSYALVNQEAVCSEPVIRKTTYIETRREILAYLEAQKMHGKVEDFAVYFRDLENGPVFGINELTEFVPASLLKLPLAIIYLLEAEVQPELLTKAVRYTDAFYILPQRTPARKTALPNVEYTIEELLHMMLAYSDNASTVLLNTFLASASQGVDVKNEGYRELGLINPRTTEEEVLHVRSYASLFRLLYNVSFLDAEHSQKILAWLAESDYTSGLVAGVPKGTVVAHKFGERGFEDDSTKQIHDCGIVYYPNNPYLLCVMTEGNDWDALEDIIVHVSRMIYEEVHSRRL